MLLLFGANAKQIAYVTRNATRANRFEPNRTNQPDPVRGGQWIHMYYSITLYLCWNNIRYFHISATKSIDIKFSTYSTSVCMFCHSAWHCCDRFMRTIYFLFQKTHPTPTSGSMQFLIVILQISRRWIEYSIFCLKSHNHTHATRSTFYFSDMYFQLRHGDVRIALHLLEDKITHVLLFVQWSNRWHLKIHFDRIKNCRKWTKELNICPSLRNVFTLEILGWILFRD